MSSREERLPLVVTPLDIESDSNQLSSDHHQSSSVINILNDVTQDTNEWGGTPELRKLWFIYYKYVKAY
jgi:hypothetical protein